MSENQEQKLEELISVFCAYLKYINGLFPFSGGYCNGREKNRDDKNIYLTFTIGREGDKEYTYDCWIPIEDLERDIHPKEKIGYMVDGGSNEER